jgi:two-component system, sensor histidine kinase ChiS
MNKFIICRMTMRGDAFLAGFIILVVTVINDFLYNNMVIQTGYLFPFGLFAFIFPQVFLLSFRFSQTCNSIEHHTGKLEQNNRNLIDMDTMKDEFLAILSHELRMPLNGIIGIAESMINGLHGLLSVESKFNLGLIAASGRRLACLVDDMFEFARLKNSTVHLNLRRVEMKSVADIVIALTEPLIGTKKLVLVNNIPSDVPSVFADESRIRQVLNHLVGNAVKYTPAGCIAISVRAAEESGWLEFSVSDMGIGMKPEKLEGIFYSFLNCDDDGACNRDGVGIGLSIARQIVELHGGSIWAESIPGSGSVFMFTLPVCREQFDQAAQSDVSPIAAVQRPIVTVLDHTLLIKSAQGSGINGRLLLVDDDIINLQLMRNYLCAEDYSVVTAASGAEALDCIGHGTFDLVLLDLMMPGMSGHELCGEIRRRFSLFQLPVIILTARYGIAELVAGFEYGANDYLIKPAHRDELLARVRTLVTLKKTVQDHDEAKYKLLQERMNPHFLFNALNTVHAMINKDRAKADMAVIMLADNYRFLIDHSFRSLIPFDVEWRFVENYLDLEQMRFRDLLETKMERQGDFACISIPPLTLQPLVENALKHGIQHSGGLSTIHVFAESYGGILRLAVRDNGARLEASDIFSRSLGNIRNRLNHYFNDVKFDVDNAEDRGVVVRVSFRFDNAEPG